MAIEDILRAAAGDLGVQQEFWDIFGSLHQTTATTNRAILAALGIDASSEESLEAGLALRESTRSQTLWPPVLVTGQSEPLGFPAGALEIVTEQGERLQSGPGLKLPLGYHNARLAGADLRLIVTPDRAWLPEKARCAGLGITLYGLRSARNWGCGDFRDLTDLIEWAVPSLHVDFIALNPLHAIHNRRPYNTSPYLPNSIFYRNHLYLDVEAVPGFDAIRHLFEDDETLAEIGRLRESPTVEYERVAALKRRALTLIFDAGAPDASCLQWIEGEGDLLRLFATCSALDEFVHHENPEIWVWPDWPEQYRDPDSPAVREFAARYAREILFHGWLQWLVDGQLQRVQARARELGMSIGLYHDLALATDRCGSDLWAHRPFYVAGCRVGSPPDDFSPSGQDWSFPPPNSARHREDGYRLFVESIRKSLRHGGALRIDHVMRLFRLYWIPEGHDATDGAYVRDYAADLVRILALESVRNRVVIVGEDLGTVEPEVRETLQRFGILSYRLLYFERNENGFKPPAEYPVQALVATTTHDLPTITGFWAGADIEARLRAGIIDNAGRHAQIGDRIREKQRLLDALLVTGLLPAEHERDAARIPELTGELHYAIAGFLAQTPAMLWLINQEDMTKEPDQQNLPGTTWQYPNWSRKMRWTLESLREPGEADREAQDCAVMIRDWIARAGRATETESAQ